MKKKNKIITIAAIIAISILGLILMVVLLNNYSGVAVDKCVETLNLIFDEDKSDVLSELTTTQFRSSNPHVFTVNDIQGFAGLPERLNDLDSITVLDWNKVFICPNVGENLFPGGCRGTGYTFIIEGEVCRLDSVDIYFD